MEQVEFELELLEEARDFLKSLTKEVRGKIGRNIRRVQKGERDPEMHQTRKGNQWYFGAKMHVGADAGSGLLTAISGSPVDIISVIILIATVVLIARYKKSPFLVLIIMGCIGAILGV